MECGEGVAARQLPAAAHVAHLRSHKGKGGAATKAPAPLTALVLLHCCWKESKGVCCPPQQSKQRTLGSPASPAARTLTLTVQSSVAPSSPQFQLLLWASPSRLPSPFTSLCFSL